MLLSTRAERLKIWADFPHFFSDHPLVTMRLSPTWLYAPTAFSLQAVCIVAGPRVRMR